MKNNALITQAEENVKRLRADELRRAGFIPLDRQYVYDPNYPPSLFFPEMKDENEFFAGYQCTPGELFSVYVHIPFCLTDCNYCHFMHATGHSSAEKDRYLDVLEKETDIWLDRLGVESIPAGSILVGGGTPTCLSSGQLDRFHRLMSAKIDFSRCSQFGYDVSPGNLIGREGLRKLEIMRSYGVDRLTLGVQSFNDELVKKLNCAHRSKTVFEAIRQARRAGFESLCIDLIYGFPGQTVESWLDTMQTAVSLDLESFQLYRLQIIPTCYRQPLIANRFKEKPEDFPTFDEVLVMKEIGFLAANHSGYDDKGHTEVFSRRDNHISHYNQELHCNISNVISFGISPMCKLENRSALKTADFQEYYTAVERGTIPFTRGWVKSPEDIIRSAVIVPLRTTSTVDKESFRQKAGRSLGSVFRKKIDQLKRFGLVQEDETKLEHTTRGFFFTEDLSYQFYNPRRLYIPRTDYDDGELNPYGNDSAL